ncbi:phage holin family protein [Chromohalobacter israelensis]|uniref:phage holin family protein n=1 Tax=Chromohalobacter israelensis TaxID=141390 RepID=UPI000FFF44F4|nr:phage holin family protein [Chromohalobacter salexigens]RXE46723.1 hypothetical protein B4O83_01380 [Chromohalobacter salexigens]
MDTEKRDSEEGSSFGTLISKVTHEITALIRDEVELGKAEMREKVAQVTTSITSMAVAGGMLLCGVLVLLAAAVLGLDTFLQTLWLSALIVGVVVAIIGFIMLQSAKKKLQAANLAPNRTMASLRKDQEMATKHEGQAKEQLK